MQDLSDSRRGDERIAGDFLDSPSGLRLGGGVSCFGVWYIYLVEELDRIWTVGFGERGLGSRRANESLNSKIKTKGCLCQLVSLLAIFILAVKRS